MTDRSIITKLEKEQAQLENIILQAEKSLSHAPEGSVLVTRYKKGVQYFYRSNPKDRNGIYMPKSDQKRAIDLIQKSYDMKVLTAAKEQWKVLDSFLRKYNPNAVMNVFKNENILRQIQLNPYELPDEQFVKVWQATEYEQKPFQENMPVHYTVKKERVRSKSEVIIANSLFHAHLPYKYECPLMLGNQVIHPDFVILRMRDRKEIYWEHLGMMDDTEYRNHALQRIRMYEANGIFPGDRLILTFETYRMPLNAVYVEAVISHYFG